MNSSPLACTKCNASVTAETVNRGTLSPCPVCGAALQVDIFPALFRRFTPGRDGELTMVDGESTCFYHPQKKAVIPCQGCGRFLCALCDCELHGQHFCPACLEVGQSKGKIKNLQNTRTLYDSVALSLAILPLLIFYVTVLTAPMALYIALRYWKAPMSIVRRSKFRFVLAIIISTLQILGWGVGIYFLVRNYKAHG
jgi:hypothetical protein